MEKALNKLKMNINWEILDKIDQDKLSRLLLAMLMFFVWIFASFLFFTKASMEKAPVQLVQAPAVKTEFRKKIDETVAGFPIEKMSRYIANQDKTTAAFLLAIAKKESNWGKRRPVLNGEDCYNYWGYREKRERMGSDGHTCFDSPKDAVYTVSNRIDELVFEYNLNTPSKMVIWKCGQSCSGDNQSSVDKWIADVDLYYNKFIDE